MDIRQTQIAIKQIKDCFQEHLAKELNLLRVSAPLFVRPESGLNDDLSGVEVPVRFELAQYGQQAEIVQSLAKWKRYALKRYGFQPGEGLYTDMDAIRPFEVLDEIHSIYVDQWDWERVIGEENRNMDFLKEIVQKIYQAFLFTEEYINGLYPALNKKLPEKITFLTTAELEDMYPDLKPEEREREICRQKKAVFLMQIGGVLKCGRAHGMRSPDYDDWNLNGDILFWNPTLDNVIELSSMGIRVDAARLLEQIHLSGFEERLQKSYHPMLLSGELPLSIGGGIGQSRICMFFLEKRHIGEVQASIWPEKMILDCEKKGIHLL